ncbi:hypothetical protein BOFE_09140 (plasmid) [Candidatus Borrelia fainii]|uniref:Arthropod-associated lipoprotein n=1 Tax=Candidatus Borrelia fainii TaxID=2518322 RepID=A0ABM8DLW1_9SPIR|nr:hypothetical protein [Candidatus Borrelia fainii]BDU63374.1 hypothetical protein BOFE_09140 [Candidatus Borrelia fainii]
MKKIISCAIVALITLSSCSQNSCPNPVRLGTGTGTGDKYIQVIQDHSKITALAKNFSDITGLLSAAATDKPYQEAKLSAAFTAIGNDNEEKFLKALAAKRAIEEAKKNPGANLTEINNEWEKILISIGFAQGDATKDGSFENILKKFQDALV